MWDFLFGEKVVTITRTITRTVLKDTGVSQAIIDYQNGKITKEEFNTSFPKLKLK